MLPLIGAGLGLLQSVGQQQQQKKQNQLAATQTALSPWTKMGVGEVQAQSGGSNLAEALGGAMSGAKGGLGQQDQFKKDGGWAGLGKKLMGG